MRYGDGGIGWGGWIVMVVMMTVIWGAIAWVIVTLVRHGGPGSQRSGESDPSSPSRILDERFARQWSCPALMASGPPPIIFSMAMPPVRANRTSSTAVRTRNTRLR